MHAYTFRIFRQITPEPTVALDHVEVATYEGLETSPWVPPAGSYFRFRDPRPPGQFADHREIAGTIDQVVTVFYGTRTVIEIYLKDVRFQ